MKINLQNIEGVSGDSFTNVKHGWHIGSPESNLVNQSSTVVFSGWVVVQEMKSVRVMLTDCATSAILAATEPSVIRNDVKQFFEKKGTLINEKSGFKFEVDLKDIKRCILSFVVENITYEVVLITINGNYVSKVLQGGNSYLFLDNDTNRSVDQFIGKYLLSTDQLDAWGSFLTNSLNIQANVNLLIAPAKEYIFEDFYPYPKGCITTIEQLMSFLQTKDLGDIIIFPKNLLMENRELSYSRIDTHWTDYGAGVAAKSFLSANGLDEHIHVMPNTYTIKDIYGDLGSKLESKYAAPFLILHEDQQSITLIKNGMDNHGRIWIYHNNNAPVKETLIIFGDSFSVGLSKHLSYVFSRVIYVYSVASIDINMVNKENAKFILLQTNARFIVSSPKFIDLSAIILNKINKFDESDKVKLKKALELLEDETFYYSLMSNALK